MRNALDDSCGGIARCGYHRCFSDPSSSQGLGGHVQVFFFHAPVARVAVLAFFVPMVNSILFLKRDEIGCDIQAVSAARLGFLFGILALITGMIFAENIGGSFWNLNPRDTSLFVLILICGAYFALRSAVAVEGRNTSLFAVHSILAFLTVTSVVCLIFRVYQSLHPSNSIVNNQPRFQVPFPYLLALLCSIPGFTRISVWRQRLKILLGAFSAESTKESLCPQIS